MTRDDSHDDDNNDSLDVSGPRDANYRSPDTSLLDDDEDEEEGDAVTVMGKSLANISASLSGSFCTNGNEVTNSCAMSDCTSYISDKKKVLFSDTILKERIMTDFNYILGSTTAPCCSEKNLFTDCFGMEQSEAPVEMSVETKIRNRAGESWRARAYRIKRLREERMIQDSSLVPKSGNLLMENGLQLEDNGMMRSTSFSHQKSKASKPRSMKPKEVNVEPLGCMIGNCIEPISPLEEGNDLDVEWKSRQEYIDEQDLCYDSDPGINSHRTEHEEVAVVTSDSERMALSHGRSKSDTALTQPQAPKKKWFKSPGKRRRRKMHYDSFDESLDKGKTNIGTERDEALDLIRDDFYGNGSPSSDSFDEPPPPYKSGSIGKRANTIHIDKEIRRNVQDALNETWTLTWHPTPKGKTSSKISKTRNSTSITAPRCIQLWFERGNRVRRNDIVEPKIMWRDAYHPDLASQRKLNFSTTQGPHQICLLSICRVIEAKTIDRKKYPYAKKSCSFMIRTSDDEEYVFEALNQKQRDHIVHTWKLVVARLASQAVVGDGEGMVGEFFVSSVFSVP